jgi:hypothetical protein
MKIGNKSFEMVEKDIFGNNPANQNSINVEIKKRLISGNACYRSAQNISLPCFLSNI